MTGKTTPAVFITANVGSIFEEPSVMLKIWTQEFLSTIARLDPKFVALHCQEVGGKNYEKSMQYVEDFVELLMNSNELRLFDKVRVYLDEDYSSAENFTALGNFYFIHESITDALIYDFEQRRFVEVEGKAIYSKEIENVRTKEKSKFPLEYFPECKWSRKGFLRTRWCLNGTIFDLVNIHLFHDVSNFVAIKSFPSVYSDTRRRALAYTLERFQTDEFGPVPLFLFGDFNFRTDTQGVVKHLSEGLNSSSQEDEVSIIQFKQEDKVVLSLGKKEFSHSDHQTIFTTKDGDWLREFDKELEAFSDQLFEFEISFPPSYPFEENSTGDRCYMKTRCPAWCDRVVLSHSAIPLVNGSGESENVEYGLMGRNTCMGDHKPVYLKLDIKGDAVKDVYSSSKSENHEKVNYGLVTNFSTDGKHDSEKTLRAGLKYSEMEIEKLACSLEALMSQNSSFSRETESNIEPDLSRCTSCRMHQHMGRVGNNPGGEEISNENLILDDKKIIALLASEIKVPEEILQKIEIQDTGQKMEKETCSWELKSSESNSERFGAVKRVNSASLVENSPKKEDWKNSRCNSDVSWSPTASVQTQGLTKSWKGAKQFNRGSSRIRLISSSNSLNSSLPRLTSHHSSSDEEWFEEIEEGDDDVLRMNDAHDEMKIYRDDCGDKGAVAKILKPASESISKTDIFVGTKKLKEDSPVPEELPQGTMSCMAIDQPVEADTLSQRESELYIGKSLENVFESEGGRNKIKPVPRAESSPIDRDPKMSSKMSKGKPLSILKRLTERRSFTKEPEQREPHNKSLASSSNRESFETLIVDPSEIIKEPNGLSETETKESSLDYNKSSEDLLDYNKSETTMSTTTAATTPRFRNFRTQMGDVKQKEDKNEMGVTPSTESWETIELSGKKSKDLDICYEEKEGVNDYQTNDMNADQCIDSTGTTCCCILQ